MCETASLCLRGLCDLFETYRGPGDLMRNETNLSYSVLVRHVASNSGKT